MTRILWCSRHEPQDRQLEELELHFGEVKLIYADNYVGKGRDFKVRSGQQIDDIMVENNCDEIVAVLPIHLIHQLTQLGYKPIKPVMVRDMGDYGVRFHHSHFEKINNIAIEKEKL